MTPIEKIGITFMLISFLVIIITVTEVPRPDDILIIICFVIGACLYIFGDIGGKLK